MTATQAPVTPRWLFGGPTDLLIPIEGKEACPIEIWQASESLRQAHKNHQQAREQAAAAQAALRQAQAVDDAADRHSILANSRLDTPQRAAPKAAAAVALSDRRVKATSAEVTDRVTELANQILRHFDEWSEAVEQGRDDVKSDIMSEIDRLAALFRKLSTSERVVIGLARYPNFPHGGALTGVNFGEMSPKWRRFEEERRAEELAKLQTSIAQGHHAGMVSRNDINQLLAALTTLAVPIKRVASARTSP